jgi:hypothetical protein
VRCPFFAAERIELGSGQTVELDGKGAPQVFTTLAGWLTVAADGHSVLLNAGQSVALLAASSPAVLTATEPTTLIRGWLDPASEPLS